MLEVAAHVLWHLVSTYLCHCEKASGGRKTFQVGSCKTAQGGHEENLLLVPAEIMFGREHETKGFVEVKKTQWTNHGRPSTVDLYAGWPITTLAFPYTIHTWTLYRYTTGIEKNMYH